MSQNDLDALQNHNWHDAFIKLKAYALGLQKQRYKGLPLPKGRTLDDLIQEAITSILDENSSRNWDSTNNPDIDEYLMKVVSSLMWNLFDSEEMKTTSSYSQSPIQINSLTTDSRFSPHVRMDLAALVEEIQKALEDDEIAYYVFWERLDGLANREIAKSLGIEIKEVENARKRIKLIVKKYQNNIL